MKILVPTDFSQLSLRAIEYSAKLAKKIKAEIILLNVVYINTHPKVSTALKTDEIEDSMAERASVDFGKIVKQVRKENRGIKVTWEIIKGFPFETVVEKTARKHKADLIIMGTKGASGLKKFLFGSNTVAVIGKSSIPVLSVPEHAGFIPIKNIIYASDLDKTNKEFKRLLPLAKAFHSSIHLVHVNTSANGNKPDKEKIKSSLIRKFRYPEISVDVVNRNSITNTLDEMVSDTNGDLLAMFAHKHVFAEKLLAKSVTREIAYNNRIPLLTFGN